MDPHKTRSALYIVFGVRFAMFPRRSLNFNFKGFLVQRRTKTDASAPKIGSSLVISQQYVTPLGFFKMSPKKDRGLKLPDLEIPEKYKGLADVKEKVRTLALMRAVREDHMRRLVSDERHLLFDSKSKEYIPLGSIVVVEYVTGRKKPHLDVIAGVYVRYNEMQSESTMKLLTKIMGTSIEWTIPIYLPSVRRIVLSEKSDYGPEVKEVPEYKSKEFINTILEKKLRKAITDESIKSGRYDVE